MLLGLCMDGITREFGRSMAEDLQDRLVKPRQAPLLQIRTGQRLCPL